MTMTKIQQAEQATALERLRDDFKPGDTVRVILRHVSRSGMQRSISVLDGNDYDVSGQVARALGRTFDTVRGGVKVGGCGMDMGFELVYSLSVALYGRDGYACLGTTADGPRCPSSAHQPRSEKAAETTHHDGYALYHRWL